MQAQDSPNLTTSSSLDDSLRTESHNTKLSTPASLGIAIITGIPVIVNIVYVIVCFKTLRKKFHNLLVLTLCICDCFLGISLTWYIIASLLDSMRDNVASCLFQTFAVGYGLVSSYSIILIICLERYAVVRARNFGISETLDRFKYLAIGGTLALGFLFTIETVLFIHVEDTIVTCSVPNLYGDRFSFFVQVMIGGVTTILILIVIVTIRTSNLIWDLFYGNSKVHSSDIELTTHNKNEHSQEISTTINSCTEDAASCHQTYEPDTSSKIHIAATSSTSGLQAYEPDTSLEAHVEATSSSSARQAHEPDTSLEAHFKATSSSSGRKAHEPGTSLEAHFEATSSTLGRQAHEPDTSTDSNFKTTSPVSALQTQELDTTINNQTCNSLCRKAPDIEVAVRVSHICQPELFLENCMNESTVIPHSQTILNELQNIQHVQVKRKISNVQQLIMQMRTERLNDGRYMALSKQEKTNRNKTFKFGAWEFRAFATSIIIALTTIVFTGPFIASYWIDVFTGTLLPQQNRFWLFVPLVMNSIINPFIYAWRIPEIRKELRKVFCC